MNKKEDNFSKIIDDVGTFDKVDHEGLTEYEVSKITSLPPDKIGDLTVEEAENFTKE